MLSPLCCAEPLTIGRSCSAGEGVDQRVVASPCKCRVDRHTVFCTACFSLKRRDALSVELAWAKFSECPVHGVPDRGLPELFKLLQRECARLFDSRLQVAYLFELPVRGHACIPGTRLCHCPALPACWVCVCLHVSGLRMHGPSRPPNDGGPAAVQVHVRLNCEVGERDLRVEKQELGFLVAEELAAGVGAEGDASMVQVRVPPVHRGTAQRTKRTKFDVTVALHAAAPASGGAGAAAAAQLQQRRAGAWDDGAARDGPFAHVEVAGDSKRNADQKVAMVPKIYTLCDQAVVEHGQAEAEAEEDGGGGGANSPRASPAHRSLFMVAEEDMKGGLRGTAIARAILLSCMHQELWEVVPRSALACALRRPVLEERAAWMTYSSRRPDFWGPVPVPKAPEQR